MNNSSLEQRTIIDMYKLQTRIIKRFVFKRLWRHLTKREKIFYVVISENGEKIYTWLILGENFSKELLEREFIIDIKACSMLGNYNLKPKRC